MPELATFVTFDNVVNSWRQRALFYLDTTIWGRIWEIIDFLLNLSLCTIYIINTTYVDAHLDPARIPEANRQLEFLLALIFLVQYTVRFVIINGNPRALEHVIVVLGFVSILVGYFWSISNQHIRDSYISQGAMALFVPFRFLRLHYAINRLLAMTPTGPRWLKLSLIKQEAVALAGDIVVVILSFAGLVHSGINWYSQTYHQRAQGFTFLDAIYFIVMSGLGDNGSIPNSTFSELISMAIVGLLAFAIPPRVAKLVDLALKTSSYSKTVALPAATRHAIVCGEIELESIRQFLHEFFNADHGPNIFKTTIVILHPQEPAMEMKALLRDPVYANRVHYVKGRATNFKSLKRARIDLATCVYILTRKHSHGNGIEEDADTVLIALALNAFLASVKAQKFQVYAQTLLPNSISHLTYLQTSRVICVDEMRMGVMAQNCATPGFATLAFMLSTSVADHRDWDFAGILSESLAQSSDDRWVQTYLHGISQEIYQAHVPGSLAGKSFFKATRYFYRCHGILVFAVGTYTEDGHYQMLLAPRNYVLRKFDMLFAIADDVQQVLSAMMYAERVSIRSTKIVRHEKSQPSTPPPSINQESPWNILNVLPFVGNRSKEEPGDNKLPQQLMSPRRMVSNNKPAKRPTNYISDSDSSYFSPAGNRNTVNDFSNTSVKGVVRTRIDRVARRNDLVPETLHNHIVICDASDMFPRNIELLIQALKNAFEDDDLPVVILSPGALDRQRELVLNDFVGVYVVKGTPLSQDDLRRTLVYNAQKAIILGSCNTKIHSEEGVNDSMAILANMNIQALCGSQFFMTTELLDIENIRYLDHTQLLGEPLLKRTFMGGHIFMPAMIDTALCQCYFSSHILDVLRHLTFSHFGMPPGSQSSMDSYSNNSNDMMAVIRSFRPGKLNLLQVPKRFLGKRYDTLVLTLMKQHAAVPLGLYRMVTKGGQTFNCVLCNPPPATQLTASDAVYVLGPRIAGWQQFAETPLASVSIAPHPNNSSNHSGNSRHTVYSHNTSSGLDLNVDADVSDN